MSKIPSYILCSTPDLARQVLEKIEREIELMPTYYKEKGSKYFAQKVFGDMYPLVICTNGGQFLTFNRVDDYESQGITNFTKAEDYLGIKKSWKEIHDSSHKDGEICMNCSPERRGCCSKCWVVNTAHSTSEDWCQDEFCECHKKN